MPTDDERRAVARRLRRSRSEWSGMGWRLWLGPKFCAVVLSDGNRDELEDAAMRLADLIEPSCDRDALLALARYMDKDVAETEAHFSNVISTKSVSDYARRIREALGVESSDRREVARRLRSFVTDDSVYADVDACRVLHSIGLYYKDIDRIYFSGFDVARLADLIEPPYPDATASYKGWRAEVYDPDGVLVSPSNLAADLVRAYADGKGPSVAVVKVDGERLERLVHDAVVKLTGIDRDAPREGRRHDG